MQAILRLGSFYSKLHVCRYTPVNIMGCISQRGGPSGSEPAYAAASIFILSKLLNGEKAERFNFLLFQLDFLCLLSLLARMWRRRGGGGCSFCLPFSKVWFLEIRCLACSVPPGDRGLNKVLYLSELRMWWFGDSGWYLWQIASCRGGQEDVSKRIKGGQTRQSHQLLRNKSVHLVHSLVRRSNKCREVLSLCHSERLLKVLRDAANNNNKQHWVTF